MLNFWFFYKHLEGFQIHVIGTVPNGTEPISANYSIDGGPPQTRSIPTESGCAINVDPFFKMTGLTEGRHNITIIVVEVGSRPYMFNFFALDPKASPSDSENVQESRKLKAGEITEGVMAGVIICILLCVALVIFRRRMMCNGFRMRHWKTTTGPSDKAASARGSFERNTPGESTLPSRSKV